jgi:hypothetical protein
VAPKDAEMMAFAQLEVMAFMPTLQVRERVGWCVVRHWLYV